MYIVKCISSITKKPCENVLHPCAGWGDRLIATNIKYTGFDTNKDINYGSITDFFNYRERASVTIEPFDAVITSPPYMDMV